MIDAEQGIKPTDKHDYFDIVIGKLCIVWLDWHWQIVRLEDGSEYYRYFLGFYWQTKGPRDEYS